MTYRRQQSIAGACNPAPDHQDPRVEKAHHIRQGVTDPIPRSGQNLDARGVAALRSFADVRVAELEMRLRALGDEV